MPIESAKSSVSDFDSSNADNSTEPIEKRSIVDEELERVFEQLRIDTKNQDANRLDMVNAAIQYIRDQLKSESLDEDIKRQYVDKLVALQLEKQKIEECTETGKVVVIEKGHEFALQRSRGRHNPYCEVCMHTIWRLVQSWRRCEVCGFRAHDKCCQSVSQICPGVVVSKPDFELVTAFPTESTLLDQDFKCAECYSDIGYGSSSESRLCSYTGQLYCKNCHWNDSLPLPATLVHSLDGSRRVVCRSAKRLLSLIENRPLIDMSRASPILIKCHSDFKRVQKFRRNFLYMKCYFVSCRNARKLRILQYLNQHQHFVEGADLYSIKELRLLCDGTLIRDLEGIHTVFRKHIEKECEICKGNGFYCELCETQDKSNEIIFPFSDDVSLCPICLASFHTKCFEKHSMHCPRCERRKRRLELKINLSNPFESPAEKPQKQSSN
ncbi:hypothetical protein WR25_02268 [Diploscapter pachys]|uniref:Phorbol-ester/DAG-type domain-containing protein n=1 Tax=Diploscapter pachys TaxID=2018661 RepID=A0A2A2JGF3_9BILA|nr:hypothetical protein WR25_02268 [Diploscapter pachys]